MMMRWNLSLLILILLFVTLHATRPECPSVAARCQLEGQPVQPLRKCLGDRLLVMCRPYSCDGDNYIIDHSSQQGEEFEVISERPVYQASVTIATVSDAGVYRCRKMCHDGTTGPPCNLTVEGEIDD